VTGLVCSPDVAGTNVCSATCSRDHADCGKGFACVVGFVKDATDQPGTCVKLAANLQKPAGAVCTSNAECGSGACDANLTIGRSLCAVGCKADTDCGDGQCIDQECVGGASAGAGLACPAPPGGCGCAQSTSSADALWSLVAFAGLGFVFARRRAREQ
jgi:hypothetical protein